jgi:hypothetical protein
MMVSVLLVLLLSMVGSVDSVPQQSSFVRQQQQPKRPLPSKVIVGYTTARCQDHDDDDEPDNDYVYTAVRQGVNVVIWAFYPQFNVSCLQRTIQELDQRGFDDTLHLTSLGGWNGPHLNASSQTTTTADDFYQQWKQTVGDFVHGIDIDLEGNDQLSSPLNFMSTKELDRVGTLIELAKADGYIITMAPPQSYFDIHTSEFSQFLNLTDPNRSWHSDFSYFGRNLYAYWMARYGNAIDLVMVQFYESYSRAAMEITLGHFTPENYLQQYVWDLNQFPQGPGWWIDLGDAAGPEFVSVPLSKLVWGLCNAWCRTENQGRHYYFPSVVLNAAYQNLWDWMLEPRGFMFWEIRNEGMDGIYYARDLNSILHIRSETKDPATTIGLT